MVTTCYSESLDDRYEFADLHDESPLSDRERLLRKRDLTGREKLANNARFDRTPRRSATPNGPHRRGGNHCFV